MGTPDLAGVSRLRLALIRAVAFAVAVTALAALPAAAQAATWTVNTTADPAGSGCAHGGTCSIRQAIQAASPGDVISIPASASHYTLTLGALEVTTPSLWIAGAGAQSTVIDAGRRSRVLDLAPSGGTTTLSGVTVTGGSVTGSGAAAGGGGIYLHSGGLALASATVSGNAVSIQGGDGLDGGGGIYLAPGTQATITASTIARNTATINAAGGSNGGAGAYDASATSTYLNDTFSANALTVSAGSSNGGGAVFHEGGPGTISDATIAQNTANVSSGGIFDNAGAYTVKNTIVAQNGTGCAGPGGIVSAGYNLEGSSTCGMTMPTDMRNTNPMLGPLANNGGPTQTLALTPASPAIDAGSCTDANGDTVSSDQRGEPRPQPAAGACDIGAFEYAPASPVPLVVGGSRPVVLGSTRATFAGVVNPGGLPSTARFEYGLDGRYRPSGVTVYDHFTAPVQLAGGYHPVTISATVGGLVPAALYHVRLIITNGAGTGRGPDQTFVTAADPPPRPPVLGRYLDASPSGGLVRVQIGGTFVPLTEPRRLPVGTEFDARGGTVAVTVAGTGGRASATFSGAVFRVGQPAFGPNRGLPVTAIVDGAFTGVPRYQSCHGHTTVVLQTLHTSIGGRWRVKGRFSAATARAGAQWATADRCDGTLTTVHRGAVLLARLGHTRGVTVGPGRSVLVRRLA
jgi:hypothetical protein